MRLIIVYNTNSNVSVDDNNSNDIHVPMYCEHVCTLCNSLFQTNEQDKYTCELCAKSNRIQRERIASGNNLSKQADRIVSRCTQILPSIDIGIMSPYQYPASTEDMAIQGILYA